VDVIVFRSVSDHKNKFGVMWNVFGRQLRFMLFVGVLLVAVMFDVGPEVLRGSGACRASTL
jgi:hypothetical protein